MTNDLVLRIKYVCGRYWNVLVPALVLLSAVAFAGAGVGIASEPEPQPVDVTTDSMTVNTTLSTEAVVTGNTSLYAQDEVLSDMPVYLRSATPEVRLIAVTQTPADRTVAVTQQIVLDLSATRNGEVFWRDSRTLAVEDHTVTNGTAQTEVTLNVQKLANEELADVTAEAGSIGTIEAQVSTVALYETDRYSGQTAVDTPLSITDRVYELETPQQDEQANMTTQQVAAGGNAASGPLGPLGRVSPDDIGAALGGVAAVGLALGVWLTRKRIGDFDTFRRHYERVQYVEWISQGTVPATGQYVRIPVDSLLDVVDIAIDSEKRVIHDTEKDIYAVVDGNTIYEYRDSDGKSAGEFGFGSVSLSSSQSTSEDEHRDDSRQSTDVFGYTPSDTSSPPTKSPDPSMDLMGTDDD